MGSRFLILYSVLIAQSLIIFLGSNSVEKAIESQSKTNLGNQNTKYRQLATTNSGCTASQSRSIGDSVNHSEYSEAHFFQEGDQEFLDTFISSNGYQNNLNYMQATSYEAEVFLNKSDPGEFVTDVRVTALDNKTSVVLMNIPSEIGEVDGITIKLDIAGKIMEANYIQGREVSFNVLTDLINKNQDVRLNIEKTMPDGQVMGKSVPFGEFLQNSGNTLTISGGE